MGSLAESPRELEAARADGYAMLAILVDRGVCAATRDLVLMSPRLARVAIADDEQLAADHCHVFDLVAPPYRGMILAPDGVVSGADHLSHRLRELSRSRGVEAAPRLDRLLEWLVPYEAAVLRTGRALPIALVAEIVELALHHRAELAHVPRARAVVAGETLDLDHPDTDLRAIASFLARPSASGVLLTRDDITRIGRGARVPRGFGDRARMIENLLRSAAELGELPAVARALGDIVCHHREHLAVRCGEGTAWDQRLAIAAAVCQRLEREARTV